MPVAGLNPLIQEDDLPSIPRKGMWRPDFVEIDSESTRWKKLIAEGLNDSVEWGPFDWVHSGSLYLRDWWMV